MGPFSVTGPGYVWEHEVTVTAHELLVSLFWFIAIGYVVFIAWTVSRIARAWLVAHHFVGRWTR